METRCDLGWSDCGALLAGAFLSVLLAGDARAQCAVRTFDGTASFDFLGWSVDGGMDVDGDGVPDVVVGALGYSQGGRAEVYSGRTGALLHVVHATSFSSCALAGDVDGDGHADIVVGDFGDVSLGLARVVSGATGAVLHTFTGSGPQDYFGYSVAGAGDVDGDGFADVVVGAPQPSSAVPGSGYVRVFSGATGAMLHEFTGAAVGDRFGYSVAGAGDVDGDGRDDVVVGAWRNSRNGASSGMARVFSGASGAILHELLGNAAGDSLGQSVSGAGDVDGDGRADFVVGAPGDSTAASSAGKVLVVSGATGATVHAFFGEAASQRLGSAVAAAGDVDGDGVPEVAAVSAGGASSARVWSGADGSVLLSVAGVHLTAIAGAGDVDGDGFDEILVGDPIFGPPERGRATVYSGPAAAPATYCTAKTSPIGCLPTIASSGAPSTSSSAPFLITASGIASSQGGILFYGTSGPAAIPFQGGTLCVQPPTQRTPAQASGGSPPPSDCTGSFSLDFNAWIQAGHDLQLAPGVRVNAQYWYRDPGASFTSGLTDALQFTICSN